MECTKCHEDKPEDMFSSRQKQCKACLNEAAKARYREKYGSKEYVTPIKGRDKKCGKCKKYQPFCAFWKGFGAGGTQTDCKVCMSKYYREWRRKRREKQS